MRTAERRLLLGSGSARRRAILAELIREFDVAAPDVVEDFREFDPRASASQSAIRKSLWCRKHYAKHWAITADTVISFRGRCVGKPQSLDQAAQFFGAFSGQRQEVITAVAFSTPAEPEPDCIVVTSSVVFKTLTDPTIRSYLSKVNPLDKAGGYDIDRHADILIESYEGSYTNIMGLPKEEVANWLRKERFI